MKSSQSRVFILGAALVCGLVCHGQVTSFAGGNAIAGSARTISGTVLDPSGAPAPGVAIMLVPRTVAQNAETISDASGKYTVNWPATAITPALAASRVYSLVARDLEHNLAAVHTIDETTTNLDLRLQPGLTISAQVQDANGKPITNATATLAIYSGNSGTVINPGQPPMRTDDQGRIQITALPQGCRYAVMNVRAPGYGTIMQTSIPEAQTHTTRFDLPALVLRLANLKLAGQVLGADGQPAANARVTLSGVGQPVSNTLPDAAGHFTFYVCEGPVLLNAVLQGAPGGLQTGRAQTVGGDTNVVIRLANVNNAGPTPVLPNNTVVASGRITITGTVFDPSGAPAPGVAMLVTPDAILTADVRSDDAGKFAISWQPFNFGTAAAPPAIEYFLVGRDLEHNFAATAGIDAKTTNVDLHLQPGLTLSGSVQDNNGAAVKTATVRLIMRTPTISSEVTRQPATLDAQGAFTISALPQGQAYGVMVTSSGFGSANVPVEASQTQITSLQLPPIQLKPADQRLEGQVLGPDDKPVPGATVRAIGTGQPSAITTTDASGHFALKVCEGTVRLLANSPPNTGNNQLGTGQVQAQGGDLNVVVKLTPLQTAAGIAQPPVPVRIGTPQLSPPRSAPLKAQRWTFAAISGWAQQHRAAVFVLLFLQAATLTIAAGAVFWLTRRKGS